MPNLFKNAVGDSRSATNCAGARGRYHSKNFILIGCDVFSEPSTDRRRRINRRFELLLALETIFVAMAEK